MINDFVNTTPAFVSQDIIGQLIYHATTNPSHIAVVSGDIHTTYESLYLDVLQWKSVLGQHVKDRAVVCLERSPKLLVITLALLWLEVTYIPVESNIPSERLHDILTDSQAEILLHDEAFLLSESALSSNVLNIDRMNFPTRSMCHHLSLPKPNEHRLAYIIYTSGSTGKPKGVPITRRALNNFLYQMKQYFLFQSNDMLLAVTTIAFDIAVLEFFLPIWAGCTILLASKFEYKDPILLKALLNRYPVTLMQSTPALWNTLFAVGWQGKNNMTALTGGEPLTAALADKLLRATAALWNMYGPTEATVWCSLKQITTSSQITVGLPIGHMEMRVLDEHYQPLLPHVKGELYISGVGLTPGYINREILNQERFIRYEQAFEGRIYRVGDIACTNEEGEFIIFGRSDNQIKLHGFRIEPEEIEAQIQRVPGVLGCAVTVYQEQLVAYIHCDMQKADFSKSTFYAHLKRYLPDYMLPTRLVYVNQIPLSDNGKIDRRALPEPSNIQSSNQFDDKNPLEALVCTIWSQELKNEQIHVDDNFFELGGHSLVAARIIARIMQELNKHVTLRDFYQLPTIREFAAHLETCDTLIKDVSSDLADFKAPWFALTDFQWMLWLSSKFEPRLRVFNVAARRRLLGVLDLDKLNRALKKICQTQEVLAFDIHPFLPLQRHRDKHVDCPVWDVVSLEHLSQEACEATLNQSYDELFYEKKWQKHEFLICARLFYLPRRHLEMQICFPHEVADERSLSIFFAQLTQAYLYDAIDLSIESTHDNDYREYVYKKEVKNRSRYFQTL